jgi:hypothetical protein
MFIQPFFSFMKKFYPILFFLDAGLLVWLSFFFLTEMDKGKPWYFIGLLVSAIIACISGLAILVRFFFGKDASDSRH